MGFQANPLQMKFLVVSSVVPLIVVAGLVHLVTETVVDVVGLVVCQLLFNFLLEIAVFIYAAIMM